jgi:outer membrane receptor protein involved in Fe transport
LTKQVGRHGWKFGWDFQRTHVDGAEANNLLNQLFATSADLGTFGAVDAGVYFLNQQGGTTPSDNAIRLRNNYNGAFAEDDWRAFRNLTLNLGVRWDYDNQFPNKQTSRLDWVLRGLLRQRLSSRRAGASSTITSGSE